ncbi:MAG: helix-turn-helix transcriptional regulator [Nocardioidaceae bacterium]|nr:helix-turn-helix transcriptional regulator [Nocardioidaceae bacterium]
MPVDRSALGAFLRSRRDRLTPAQAGIAPFPGPRRVPGLRKEELAVLAGLSPDHYSRLEQGRQSTVGDDVVEALARALRLDEVERAHLSDLAAPVRRRPEAWGVAQRPEAALLRMMSTLDHVPALVLGRHTRILACNDLLRSVLGAEVTTGSLLVRWLFLDPRARERIVNWADYAMPAVGALRYEVGRHPGDRHLAALVTELRTADDDVARWWEAHGVTDQTSVPKLIDHPVVGRLRFGIEMLTTPHDAEQRLVVYTVEPASATEQALPLLHSWGSVGAPHDAEQAGDGVSPASAPGRASR